MMKLNLIIEEGNDERCRASSYRLLMAWFWREPEALDHHQLWFIDGPDGGRCLLLPRRDDEAVVPTVIFFFPAAAAMLPP
jgi:hypothetical protein